MLLLSQARCVDLLVESFHCRLNLTNEPGTLIDLMVLIVERLQQRDESVVQMLDEIVAGWMSLENGRRFDVNMPESGRILG